MKATLNLILLVWIIILLSLLLMDVLSYYEAFGFPDDFKMINRDMNLPFVYPLFIVPLIGSIVVIAKYHNQSIGKDTLTVRGISDRQSYTVPKPEKHLSEISPSFYQLRVMDLINEQLPDVKLYIGRGNRLIANGEIIKGILIEDTRKNMMYQADADVFVELIIRQVL